MLDIPKIISRKEGEKKKGKRMKSVEVFSFTRQSRTSITILSTTCYTKPNNNNKPLEKRTGEEQQENSRKIENFWREREREGRKENLEWLMIHFI